MIRKYIATFIFCGFLSQLAFAKAEAKQEADLAVKVVSTNTIIHRTDGSEITYITRRAIQDGAIHENVDTNSKIPILLFVDGSGCYSARWETVHFLWELPKWLETKAASIVVDKPGMAPEMGAPEICPKDFAKYYSIDQRILDNLRVIQHLRKHANWWNGEIRLFGWSDGGAMGAHISAYTPEVVRAVLGGMGGGIPMSKLFEDYLACAEDRLEDGISKQECVKALRVQFAEIRDNPTSSKTWSGDANTYKVWATRLDQQEYYLFKDFSIPFLIVHGELDRNGIPVQSARTLVKWLERDGVKNFQYWEVPGMRHSYNSLGPKRGKIFRETMLKWLFEMPLGENGPPNFGADEEKLK